MSGLQKVMIYLTALISGACIMIFELVAPRLFAPYFGTSIYIWTVVIGVVMTSLSLGYFLGGKLSNTKANIATLSFLFLIAGIVTFIVCFSKDIVLHNLAFNDSNFLKNIFKISLFILAPVNLILGMVAPLSIKLLTKDKKHFGSTAGNVYAISTVGSIVGTFASGFYLIPKFSLSNILFGISITLFVCSLVIITSLAKKFIILLIIIILSLFYFNNNPKKFFKVYYEKHFNLKLVADFETKYQRIWIYDKKEWNGDIVRVLNDSQSSIFLNKSIKYTMEENLSYYSIFNKAFDFKKDIFDVLMIGGGAYTYASYFQEINPNLNIDVVEIDPDLIEVGKKYFNFVPSSKFRNFTMDGRDFLNHNQKKYDVIFLDAYKNGSATPFQLVTKEATELMSNSLNNGGLLFVNIISSLEGTGSNLYKSQFVTLDSVFNRLEVFPVFSKDKNFHQNIVLMAVKQGEKIEKDTKNDVTNVKILTDDFAPVEYYDLEGVL